MIMPAVWLYPENAARKRQKTNIYLMAVSFEQLRYVDMDGGFLEKG
jgi:hypothetical protein